MPDIRRLIFNERIRDHIGRHGVTPREVLETCVAKPLIRRGRTSTLVVHGRTLEGRYITVVLAPRQGRRYYVVTARDMNRAERRRYTKARRR
jgi:uncharacterized DUF497 family protein